jgi:hypothetical protein
VKARFAIVAMCVAMVASIAPVHGYSVLAHEALIDAAWDGQIAPTLRRRFPATSPDAVRAARAYAYGGSLIQDLGYYPFGSRLFSNLTHYVRSGDFVTALIRQSRDVDEYAFALGALAHYASDNLGHPIAVNRAVPIIYPKLAAAHGPAVLYAHSPSRHVMVEFAFDVLQVARGMFKSDVYQELIGFEVAAPLLERAFGEIYGLGLRDVFGDVDLAINTYRRAASQIIPDITRVAWRDKRDEILAATPGLREDQFIYSMTRQQYEKAYGTNYRKPGFLARLIVFLSKIVPKIGPFKPLAFEPLTPETERMFTESFAASRAEYEALLAAIRAGRSGPGDTDLDTGRRPVRGLNPLADETHADLLEELAKKQFAGLSSDLQKSLNDYYASPAPPPLTRKLRDQARKIERQVAAMNAARPR